MVDSVFDPFPNDNRIIFRAFRPVRLLAQAAKCSINAERRVGPRPEEHLRSTWPKEAISGTLNISGNEGGNGRMPA